MIYNLSNKTSAERAKIKLDQLIKKSKTIDIKEVSTKRTNSQNRYYWLIMSVYCLESGWTLSEGAQIVKNALGFYYEKNGEMFAGSTTDLTEKEMSSYIDRFKAWSASQGIMLPDSYTDEMCSYVEANKKWL